MKMKHKLNFNIIRWMADTSLMLSMYIILTVISRYWSLALWPNGGTIGVQFIVVIICFYRLGIISATIIVFFGTIFSYLFVGFYIVSPWQFFLDYCSSLFAIPIAGLLAKPIKNKHISIMVFSIIALIISLVFSTVSGVLFFGHNAPKGESVIIFALVYNSTYLIPSYVISIVLTFIFFPVFKIFFRRNNTY